jgi:hypothetical protein
VLVGHGATLREDAQVTGPRTVSRRTEVAPERLAGWVERFAAAHGDLTVRLHGDEVVLTAVDGGLARLTVPFPPLRAAPGEVDAALVASMAAHAVAERRVGVLLVRLGGHAAGVFEGPRLVASKVGSRQVHGRSAAGGWSQQRFARRREGQVRVALAAAAEVAVRVLVPEAPRLDAVVLGGDRRSVEAVLADPRLSALRALVLPPLLDVPDPRLTVLEATAPRFRAVRVEVVDPPGGADGPDPPVRPH